MVLEGATDGVMASSRMEVEQAVRQVISELAGRSGPVGRSVYLDGPPGIGKTHLVASALAEAGDVVAVLRASGDQQRRHQAFGLVSQLVGAVPADVHPAEYVLDRVDELCGSGSVVVWVDDAHHADEASLTLLRKLASSARVLPLVVLMSARPFPARERLTRIGEQVDTRLHLPAMDALMVERLAFERLGRWPGPRLRHRLGTANGNPLFVIALLRALRDGNLVTGACERDHTVDIRPGVLPQPEDLHQVVRDHVIHLDEPTREVLGALAVCGVAAEVNELAEVMFADPADLNGPIERATQAGLVGVGRDGGIDFTHDVYREVIYADLPESLRRLTHRRLAQLAEQRGQAVFVAEHRWRGRGVADEPTTGTDVAVLMALRAAAAQSEQYAPEVAADLLERAEEIPAASGDEDLFAHRIEHLFNAGRGILAERLVLERIGAITDPVIAARLQSVLIRHLVTRGEVDGALALIGRTTSIPGLPGPIRLQLTALRAFVSLLNGQFLPEGQAGALAREIATSKATEAGLILDLVQGCQAFLTHRPSTALPQLERAGKPTGAGAPIGSAEVFYAWATMTANGPAAAIETIQMIRQRPDRDAHWSDAYLGFVAGRASLLAGEWDDATAELDTAVELADDLGSRWMSTAVGGQAYIDAHRGNTVAARARLEHFRHRGLPLQFGLDYPGIAELAALEAEGNLRASATLAHSLWAASRNRPGRGILEHVGDIMRIAVLTMQPRLSAQIVADLSDDLAQARAGHGGLEAVVQLEATTELVQGMAAADPDQIAAAAAAFAAQGWGWHHSQALEELACAAAAAGDRLRATDATDTALTGFERVGAALDRNRLLARTRGLGLRRGSRETQRSSSHGWSSLTATEQRVLALIRQGLTNREIGARLFISPRTVQTHVSHILAKTGLRSRIDVARASPEASSALSPLR